MTVESATYISQLNTTNPSGSDAKSEGDDHLRLLKSAIKATFPNFTAAALNATQAQLDKLVTAVAVNASANAGAVIVDSASNVLIGGAGSTNTPLQGIALMLNSTVGSVGIGHALGTVDGNGYAQFAYNGSAIGSITQSGTTGVLYNISSDRRLKENIVDAPDAGHVVDNIRIRSFDWKSDGSHVMYGVIAQELSDVAPQAVFAPADEAEMMAVDYSKLVPVIVKELQALRSRVATLESRNA